MAKGYAEKAEGLVATVVGAAIPVLVNDHTGAQGGRNALIAGGAAGLLGALAWSGVLGRPKWLKTAGEGVVNGVVGWGTVIGVTAADKALATAPKTSFVQAQAAQVRAAQVNAAVASVPPRGAGIRSGVARRRGMSA